MRNVYWDLDGIDWSDSIKEHQRNWIGKSEGCSVFFQLDGHNGSVRCSPRVPTRSTVSPSSRWRLNTNWSTASPLAEYRDAVNRYVNVAKNKTERERQAEKKVSGHHRSIRLHPFTGAKAPVWVGEYVLAGYGTGAVMAVPAHDARAITSSHATSTCPSCRSSKAPAGHDIQAESWDGKGRPLHQPGIIDGLEVKTAISTIIGEIEARGYGKGKTNYRLRDAAFGRQRYWGEPIPIYYNDDIPSRSPTRIFRFACPRSISSFRPKTESRRSRAHNWTYRGHPLETTTMPGWAASSWYFLRYMDPRNDKAIASKEAIDYWRDVDLYIGGSGTRDRSPLVCSLLDESALRPRAHFGERAGPQTGEPGA